MRNVARQNYFTVITRDENGTRCHIVVHGSWEVGSRHHKCDARRIAPSQFLKESLTTTPTPIDTDTHHIFMPFLSRRRLPLS